MVEFRFKFDSSTTAALNKNTFKKMWWFFLLFSLIFVGLGALSVAAPEDKGDLIYGIIMITFGVLFTPLVLLLTKIMQKSLDKSMSIMSSDTESIFTFEENKVTIEQIKGEDYYAKTVTSYNYFYKVTEDANTYFLYISKMQSHVVHKNALTQGTLEELNSYLQKNLGEKFKRK